MPTRAHTTIPAATLAAIVAGTLAACAGASAATSAGSLPVGLLEIGHLAAPVEHRESGDAMFVAADPSDPAAVAMRTILDGLTGQGLIVHDIGTDELRSTPAGWRIRVSVTHGDLDGSEYSSVYEIDLSVHRDGTWWVVGARQVG